MVRSRCTKMYLIGRILSVLVAICITVLSFIPSRGLGDITSRIPFADKGAHALAYAVFGFFLYLAVSSSSVENGADVRKKKLGIVGKIVLVFLVGTLFGLLIELLQPVFGRGIELADLIADAIGTLTGAVLAQLFLRVWRTITRRRST